MRGKILLVIILIDMERDDFYQFLECIGCGGEAFATAHCAIDTVLGFVQNAI